MSPEFINNISTLVGVVVAVLGAFLFAFWVAMGIWAFNDIRSRSRDWLSIFLAVVLVLIFPIIGLVLYTMIRPKETLAEVYDRALEEEALLRELEVTLACPTCGIPVKEAWVFCPSCHNQLQHTCPSCSKLVRNEWEICVYCGVTQQSPVAEKFFRQPAQSSPTLQATPQSVLVEPEIISPPSPPPVRRRRPNPFQRDTTTSGTPSPNEPDDVTPYRPA